MADLSTARDVAVCTHMAVLVDGDNAQPSLIGGIVAEAVRYGAATVRRIYGDWTSPQMSGWKKVAQEHAFQPMQQFRNTTGKNATDSALIIDAMDLLHSGNIDGFCIVSSDSDFTRLATRIREQGLFVMGIGEPKTPKAFINACNVFALTSNLGAEKSPDPMPGQTSDDWTKLVRQVVIAEMGDDGWAYLAAVGSQARKLDPAFDPRSYGTRQLSAMIKSRRDLFLTREYVANEQGSTVIDVKLVE